MGKKLPVIASAKYISFGWYANYVSELQNVASKRGYDVDVIYDINDLERFKGFSHVIVVGTDGNWLDSVFEKMDELGIKGLAEHGDIMKHDIYEIYTDQRSAIRQGLELFHVNGRYNVAIFGVKKADTSDRAKVEAFYEENVNFDPHDIYYTYDNIQACFEEFHENISKYDAVICADDITGIYLISECRKNGIRIPEDLFVVGNGNIRLGNFCSPTLTTTVNPMMNRDNSHIDILLQVYDMLTEYPYIGFMHVGINAILIERGSTNAREKRQEINGRVIGDNSDDQKGANMIQDPVVRELRLINYAFSTSDEIDIAIVARQIAGENYTQIAGAIFMSIDSVKYRLKKIYKRFNVSGRKELLELFDKYNISINSNYKNIN